MSKTLSITEDLTNKLKQLDWQIILTLFVAAFLRFFLLELRPPHHDEGVNGWFIEQMIANGFYKYDPTNYHGPLHFYILFVFQMFLGRDLWVLRLPTVLMNLLTIYWIFKFSKFIGKRVCLITAVAVALSPAYTYYVRYVNFDINMMFFEVLIIWGIVGLYTEGKAKYLWAIGLGSSLMICAKETYIIHLGCLLIAWICLFFWEKISPSTEFQKAKQEWTLHDLTYVVLVGIFIIIFFYSGTFLNFPGIKGILETYTVWFKTGMKGVGHEKPFQYWATLFIQYEQVAVLGFFAGFRYLFPSNKWIRYIAIYGIGVFLAYSVVPYKTPWCVVELVWPFHFIFGHFVSSLLEGKGLILIKEITTWLFIFSAIITCKLNFFDYTNSKEPYVYVMTFNDIKKVTEPLFALAKKDPVNYHVVGHIMRLNYWPLPWLLTEFPNVGYYDPPNGPQNVEGDFLVVQNSRIYEVEQKLQKQYFAEVATLRDSQESSKIYFDYEKFKDIFPDRKPEFIPFKPLGPGQGLLALFYPNSECTGESKIKKGFGRIDLYWDNDNRPLPAPFGIEFSGEINIPRNIISLGLTTDDGGFLEIDGARIIDDPGPHPAQEKTGTYQGTVGWKRIKAKIYDIGGNSQIKLTWQEADGSWKIIPGEFLRFNEVLLKQ